MGDFELVIIVGVVAITLFFVAVITHDDEGDINSR